MENQKLIKARENYNSEKNGKELSQQAAAALIGIPFRSYQSYEYGNREPSVSRAIKIAKFYGVAVEELFDNVELSK